jgi:hypothetical protein
MSKDPFKVYERIDIGRRYMSINLTILEFVERYHPYHLSRSLSSNIAYSVGDDNCKHALKDFEHHTTTARLRTASNSIVLP